jgi:hypothetical protein
LFDSTKILYIDEIKPAFGPQSGGIDISILGTNFLTPGEMDQHSLNVVFNMNNIKFTAPVYYIDSKEIRIKLPKVDFSGLARVSLELTSHNENIISPFMTKVFNFLPNDDFKSITLKEDQSTNQSKNNIESVLSLKYNNMTGFPILHLASYFGMKSIIKYILNSSKSLDFVNRKDNYGCTALYWACFSREYETIETLVNYGASINIVCNFKETPLKLLLDDNNKEGNQILIDSKAAKLCLNKISTPQNEGSLTKLISTEDLENDQTHLFESKWRFAKNLFSEKLKLIITEQVRAEIANENLKKLNRQVAPTETLIQAADPEKKLYSPGISVQTILHNNPEMQVRVEQKLMKKIDEMKSLISDSDNPNKLVEYYWLNFLPVADEIDLNLIKQGKIDDNRKVEVNKEMNTIKETASKEKRITFKLLVSIPDFYKALWFHRGLPFFENFLNRSGHCRLALQVGNYMIEWDEQGIIIPRFFHARYSVGLFEFGPNVFLTKEDLPTVIIIFIIIFFYNFSI